MFHVNIYEGVHMELFPNLQEFFVKKTRDEWFLDKEFTFRIQKIFKVIDRTS